MRFSRGRQGVAGLFLGAVVGCSSKAPPVREPEAVVLPVLPAGAAGRDEPAPPEGLPPAPPAPPPPPLAFAAARCEKMKLEITATTTQSGTVFAGTLTNLGTKAVTLVEPGDGSESGWRTPSISWKIMTVGGAAVAPQKYGRCGNVNPIDESEVFDLRPTEQHKLGAWFGRPYVAPGKYVVRAIYENDPKAKLMGIALGAHSDPALDRIRKSTACRVESNSLTVDL